MCAASVQFFRVSLCDCAASLQRARLRCSARGVASLVRNGAARACVVIPAGDILLFALRLVHQRARASFGSCENVLLLDAARLPEPWLQCDLVYDFFMDPRRVSMPTAATSTSARLQP